MITYIEAPLDITVHNSQDKTEMQFEHIFYPESKFGGFTDIDGTVAFYSRVNALIDPSFVVLDVGCGRGAYAEDKILFRKNLRILKSKVSRVIGIDVNPLSKSNPFLDEFRLIEGESWPIETNSINLITCDNVLEHVAEPDTFFAEIRRTLKVGGYVCIRTPNRWSYVGITAQLVPNRCHVKLLCLVQDKRKGEDIFPTFYRCNSIRKLKQVMQKYGFDSVVYGYEAEPSYLSFSKFAYFLGVIHQKFAPGFIKPVIFAFGQKT